jgi:hypothetical protein
MSNAVQVSVRADSAYRSHWKVPRTIIARKTKTQTVSVACCARSRLLSWACVMNRLRWYAMNISFQEHCRGKALRALGGCVIRAPIRLGRHPADAFASTYNLDQKDDRGGAGEASSAGSDRSAQSRANERSGRLCDFSSVRERVAGLRAGGTHHRACDATNWCLKGKADAWRASRGARRQLALSHRGA